jgi:hypothetical protein
MKKLIKIDLNIMIWNTVKVINPFWDFDATGSIGIGNDIKNK